MLFQVLRWGTEAGQILAQSMKCMTWKLSLRSQESTSVTNSLLPLLSQYNKPSPQGSQAAHNQELVTQPSECRSNYFNPA